MAVDSPVIVPLTPERWDDLVDLFGPKRGAASGCWCMWHRLPGRAAWNEMGAEGRREAFHDRVEEGPPPGLLAYRGGVAVGWVALAPRDELPRFRTQKVSALPADPAVDGEGEGGRSVFALHCFYIRAGHRKTGLMRALATAAIAAARAAGASAVDACPIEPDRPMMWGEGFVGLVPLFQSLGFTEIARRSPRRPLMRLSLG